MLTRAQLKQLSRATVKVVAGGPTTKTRGTGLIGLLDQVIDAAQLREDVAANVPILDPLRTDYLFPFTVKQTIGGQVYFFGTRAAGGPFPAPTTPQGTADWQPEAAPLPEPAAPAFAELTGDPADNAALAAVLLAEAEARAQGDAVLKARLDALVAGANGNFDTFLELYNQFLADESAASALTQRVGALEATPRPAVSPDVVFYEGGDPEGDVPSVAAVQRALYSFDRIDFANEVYDPPLPVYTGKMTLEVSFYDSYLLPSTATGPIYVSPKARLTGLVPIRLADGAAAAVQLVFESYEGSAASTTVRLAPGGIVVAGLFRKNHNNRYEGRDTRSWKILLQSPAGTPDTPGTPGTPTAAQVAAVLDPAIAQRLGKTTPGNTAAPVSLVASRAPALAPFIAALQKTKTQAVNVVFLGTSTIFGVGASTFAKNVVSVFAKKLQDAYPGTSGTEASVYFDPQQNFQALPGTGVKIYNGGSNQGPNANQLLVNTAAIGQRNPALVWFQNLTVDWFNGVPPATAKAAMVANINNLNAARTAATPCTYVLVLPFGRWDSPPAGPPYLLSAYAEICSQIARERTDTVALVFTEDFAAVGMPGADPLGLGDGGQIHMSDAGHAFSAELWWRGLGLASASAAGAAAAPAASDRLALESSSLDTARGLQIAQHNNGPQAASLLMKKSRGTAANPAETQPGDLIGYIHQAAYFNGAYTTDRAAVTGIAETDGGIALAFIAGNTNGNYTPALRVGGRGNVAIGNFGSAIPYALQPLPEQFNVNGRVYLANQAEPATPSSGGVTYVENGALKYKGTNGTVTVLAPA